MDADATPQSARPTDLLTVTDHPLGVRQLTLSDPSGRNPINPRLRTELLAAMRDAIEAPAVRAIVLTGSGKHFSVGGDIAEIDTYRVGQPAHARMRSVGALVQLIGTCRKPLVAAVKGHCLGAGAGLALLCDTIVVGRSASLGFPFLKIGLGADFGLSFTLSRRLGLAAASQALLYAKTFGAEQAVQCGLADELVEDEAVQARALDRAGQLAAMPAYALGLIKQMFNKPALSLESALDAEALTQSICFESPDLKEGVAAFKERRTAVFLPSGSPAKKDS